MRIGYFLSSEEHGPQALVEQARRAEEAGFHALWISDHFHPWNDEQGHSPLVWSTIGALSQATRLPVTTAVTCPTVRTHPAIIAQAAATSAVLHEGRFGLGVGSLLRCRRGAGPSHGPPTLAQRGPAGRAGAGPPHARALRAGL
jgi:G6PDH family F420-dependent oxidoreductase